jgi:hypothetical protein
MRKYLTFAEAAQRLAGKVSACTVWRWSAKGFYVRAVHRIIRLRYVHIGRRLFTKEEWLEQFIDELSAARDAERDCRASKPGRKVDRILEIYEAEAVLRRAGI